jgi:hypothetical protein
VSILCHLGILFFFFFVLSSRYLLLLLCVVAESCKVGMPLGFAAEFASLFADRMKLPDT